VVLPFGFIEPVPAVIENLYRVPRERKPYTVLRIFEDAAARTASSRATRAYSETPLEVTACLGWTGDKASDILAMVLFIVLFINGERRPILHSCFICRLIGWYPASGARAQCEHPDLIHGG
jgi:hypothetical protein